MNDVSIAQFDLAQFFPLEAFREGHKFEIPNNGSFFILKDGYVKLAMSKATSRSIAVSGPWDLLGAHCDVTYQATCLSDIKAYRIDKEAYDQLHKVAPSLHLALAKAATQTIHNRDNQLYVMGKRSVRERVSGTLLALYNTFRCNEDIKDGNVIRLDKTAIADLSNTTIETLSRTITEFENEGVIRRVVQFVAILDKTKLEKYFES